MAMRQDASTGEMVDDHSDTPAAKNADGGIEVKVYSPFKVYFEGRAKSISAASATGDFDILGRHHNFITLLVACDLVVRTENEEPQIITISGGIMHVKADEVVVFLDV